MFDSINQALYEALEFLLGALRFPPDMVPIIMLSICALLVLALFARTWRTRLRLRTWIAAGAALTPFVGAIAFLISLESARGTPDDYCDQHEGGYMQYTLINQMHTLKDSRDPNSGRWLILTVRAKRWGTVPHLCRFDAAALVARQFKEALKKAESPGGGELSDDGPGLIFSFRGGTKENPGVTFKRFAPSEEKISPPDIPPKREDA